MRFKLHPPEPGEAGLRRELYFLALFRVLEAGLLAFVAVNSATIASFGVRHPTLTASVAFAYLAASCALFLLTNKTRWPLRQQVAVGIAADLVVFVAALHNIAGLGNGIALLMLFNVAASALLLSLRWSLIVAALAGFVLLGEYVYTQLVLQISRVLPETAMFVVMYLAAALFINLLGRQLRATEVLAEQRGAEVDNLARVNEMIIRRMRTGLLAVDADNTIRLFNEAAWYLLGNPSPERRGLADVAPELWRRLRTWRQQQKADSTPLSLAPDTPAVIPRFTALGGGDELTLIFLDDTSLLSRRAEELTLTTLGRLAASIAHEIRNPLAAISHSAQLLRESQIEPASDQRLVEIINSQCQRMDGIVQNVLGLARRDRAQPEALELGGWAKHFLAEFQQAQPDHAERLRVNAPTEPVRAMMDPQQLQQVATVLVQNALAYGRMPDEPARVTLVVHDDRESGGPMLDVVDRGPGIPASIAVRLFEPFFTTSEHGTGLGLYIARQLCEANQASLDYIPLPGGGCCFRIVLTRAEPLARSGTLFAARGG